MCKELGHALVTNSKCKHHQEYKTWRATKPPKGSKFTPAAEAGRESDNSDDDDDDHPAAQADAPDEQTKRDAAECDLMDSIPLEDDDSDGMVEFFDAYERFDDSINDSDKDN